MPEARLERTRKAYQDCEHWEGWPSWMSDSSIQRWHEIKAVLEEQRRIHSNAEIVVK